MKIGKYKFKSEKQAKKKIASLSKEDAEGNIIPHKNTVVEIGFKLEKQAVLSKLDVIIEEAVYSKEYLVDVMWNDKQAYGWGSYRVDLDSEGMHSFLGVNYLENKV